MNTNVHVQYEFSKHFINLITPHVYEGFQSLYAKALEITNNNNNTKDLFKCFQTLLKEIPKWNSATIDTETQRIIVNSKSGDYLHDLVKALLKAAINVYIENSCSKNSNNKIDPSYYENIKMEDVIHKIYCECARELWGNPYLMFHDYKPIDLNRNQHATLLLINECIKEAIRKLLPIKKILEIYLNDKLDDGDDIATETNMRKLVKKVNSGESHRLSELTHDNSQYGGNNMTSSDIKNSNISNYNSTNNITNNNFDDSHNNKSEQLHGGSNTKKDLSNKILDILHNTSDKYDNTKNSSLQSKKYSDTSSPLKSQKYSNSSPVRQSSRQNSESFVRKSSRQNSKSPVRKSSRQNSKSPVRQSSRQSSRQNSKSPVRKSSKQNSRHNSKSPVRQKSSKNNSESSDFETSLSYNPEKSDTKYQEIFSNKNNSKSSKTFFNKYLNI